MKINKQIIHGGNNQFADKIINNPTGPLDVDQQLQNLIMTEVPTIEEREKLLSDLRTLKEGDSQEESNVAKSNLKEFLKSISSESGKEVVRQLVEVSENWISSLL